MWKKLLISLIVCHNNILNEYWEKRKTLWINEQTPTEVAENTELAYFLAISDVLHILDENLDPILDDINKYIIQPDDCYGDFVKTTCDICMAIGNTVTQHLNVLNGDDEYNELDSIYLGEINEE